MGLSDAITEAILVQENSRTKQRNPEYLHASGAQLCPLKNVLTWVESDTDRIEALPDELSHLKLAMLQVKPLNGVFVAGNIYDEWAKKIVRSNEVVRNLGLISIEEGEEKIYVLPAIPGNIDHSSPIKVAGTFDLKLTDKNFSWIYDVKSARNIYMYQTKGASFHNIAQVSVYFWGEMYEATGSNGLLPAKEVMDHWLAKNKCGLIYICRDDAGMVDFEVKPLPLITLRDYYAPLYRCLSAIRNALAKGSKISASSLPPSTPSQPWECSWRTGKCPYYEIYCKEKQSELKGTIDRAKASTGEVQS